MYRLFSQTNTTGSFQTTARLRASWKAPMFVAPSPKKQTATWPDRRYWADHAAPAAIGRWAPTIAYDPIMLWLDVGDVHRAALAAHQPAGATEQLRVERPHRRAAREGVVVAAIRREGVVVVAHRGREPGGHRLLADPEMRRTADEALEEELLRPLLEEPALDHRPVHPEPEIEVGRGGAAETAAIVSTGSPRRARPTGSA